MTKDAANFLGDRLALGFVHVEDRDLDTLRCKGANGCFAEAGCAPGDNGGDG